jgi:predicted transcriptional regulator
MDEATRAAILEGLAQAECGEFVPDKVVAEANERRIRSQEQVEDVKRIGAVFATRKRG